MQEHTKRNVHQEDQLGLIQGIQVWQVSHLEIN